MWHPPEAIKHPIRPARWPSAEVAARSLMFSPMAVGRLHVKDRTWVPAMVPWRATEEGFVTEDVLDWYGRFARGRPGALVVEATGVRDVRSGPLLRIGHDRFVPGLSHLVDAVRRASDGQTRLFIQLIDFLSIRRRPDREKFLRQFLVITDEHRARLADVAAGASTDDARRQAFVEMTDAQLAEVLSAREIESLMFGYRERVTDIDVPHIRDLPQTLPDVFADAAARAEAAGFDGVELHYAHAYTVASFLSRRNTRADGYGGTLEGRARLPLEVFHAVRARVDDRFVVGCRYLSDECIAGGSSVADSEYFGVEFARAGMDFLSLSRGGKFEDAKQPPVGWSAYPYTGPSGWECMPTVLADVSGPFGRNIPAASVIRGAVRAAGFATPVVVSGGLHDFDQMEAILAHGEGDIVGSARQTLADPDWFLKIRIGNGEDIRRCSFTNYCEGLDQKHKQVSCKLWDRVGLDEEDVKRSSDGKRRLTAPDYTPPRDSDPRKTEALVNLKDHRLIAAEPSFTEIIYERRPVLDLKGNVVPELYNAWIWLNNPSQLNSYTTRALAEIILALREASTDRSVGAVVLTGVGDRAFCSGGNTKEYAEYYSGRPGEYKQYMRLFNDAVTGVLTCDKPVINRVNGLRVGGGQEIGMACDFSIAADTARFAQAGPRHGSAPDGGSTDFLHLYVGFAYAIESCTICEPFSAYKAMRLGLLNQVVPVLTLDGKFIPNPLVITDRYLDEMGQIAYGEPVPADRAAEAKAIFAKCKTDHTRLDQAVNLFAAKLLHTFPDCLNKTIESLRKKKLEHWQRNCETNRSWLALNMMTEAKAGFRAFNEGPAGHREVDFAELRRRLARGDGWDDRLCDAIQPNAEAAPRGRR
jgi:6-oxocyclohex-1-ene-1-carbonyl-CoA hydrolase